MAPGSRPYLAVFKAPSPTFDEIGNPSRDLVEIGRAWISLTPLSVYTRERLAAAGERADVTHRVELARPSFEIPLTACLVVSGRVFEVGPKQDAPDSRDIAFMCVERQG